jgi:hypothetical protein
MFFSGTTTPVVQKEVLSVAFNPKIKVGQYCKKLQRRQQHRQQQQQSQQHPLEQMWQTMRTTATPATTELAATRVIFEDLIYQYNRNIRDYNQNIRLMSQNLHSLVRQQQQQLQSQPQPQPQRQQRQEQFVFSFDVPAPSSSSSTDNQVDVMQHVRLLQYILPEHESTTHCPISLEAFEPDEDICQIIGCAHIFKREHGLRWLRRNPVCPVCRHDLRQEQSPHSPSFSSSSSSSSNNVSPFPSPPLNIPTNSLADIFSNPERLRQMIGSVFRQDMSGAQLLYEFEMPLHDGTVD